MVLGKDRSMMSRLDVSPWLKGALLAALTLGAAVPAFADTVDVTYSAAKQTAPDFSSICANTSICDYGTENFTGWTGVSLYTSTFTDAGAGTYLQPQGVSFKGIYTAGTDTTTGTGGEWVSVLQNQYGGVSGQTYPELYGGLAVGGSNVSSYTLSLSATGVPGVNYFGIWISALDPYNNLTLYDGSKVVAEFNSANLVADLGKCSWGTGGYCGNPTAQFNGQDWQELFAYVNVFDLTGYITSVVFTNSGNTGFEFVERCRCLCEPDSLCRHFGAGVQLGGRSGPGACLGRPARHGFGRPCAAGPAAGPRLRRRPRISESGGLL